jgi:hypothetical protein
MHSRRRITAAALTRAQAGAASSHNRRDAASELCVSTEQGLGVAVRKYDLSRVYRLLGAGSVVLLTTACKRPLKRHDHVMADEGGV